MKFAHEYRKSLEREGFPLEWVELAIPYGQLKKCIKKVMAELHQLGLDRETLAELAGCDSYVQYDLDGRSRNRLRPKLTVFVHLKDGMAIDATLSPSTSRVLTKLVASKAQAHIDRGRAETTTECVLAAEPDVCGVPANGGLGEELTAGLPPGTRRVEVPLSFDRVFFDMLQTDVTNLDLLQNQEQEKLIREMGDLGEQIGQATDPLVGRKCADDLGRWRDVFLLYMDARIFSSTRERDLGARSSELAQTQLQWFQGEVKRQKLVNRFQLASSRQAFQRFVNMNALLLQNLRFQEINQLAVTKILKKFDKRIALGASQSFRVALHSSHLLAGNVAQRMCVQLSTRIISTVPQLDDYLCPVCLELAFWPIRLQCQHIFCNRCIIKMQRKNERLCPLCRADVILSAGPETLDRVREQYLRLYFRHQVKEKVKANELERGKEIFGPYYNGRSCLIM